jgi:hypothetical protein
LQSRLVIATAALAFAGAAVFFVTRRKSAPVPPPAKAAAQRPTAEEHARAAAAAQRIQAIVARARSQTGESAKPVTIRSDQVIARIDGKPVLGRQLLAFRKADEQEMTPAMYEFLLKRAIDRELVLGEAKHQGIELSPAQTAELAQVRKQAAERGETDPAVLDFEENDARTQLLQTALLEKAGVPGPYATEADVQHYYDEHHAELGELPTDPNARAEAWQKMQVQIRQKLYEEMQARYAQAVRDYLERLWAAAQIGD